MRRRSIVGRHAVPHSRIAKDSVTPPNGQQEHSKRHVSDMCINMMTRFSEKSTKKEKQDGELKYYEDLMEQCKKVIALEIQAHAGSADTTADTK